MESLLEILFGWWALADRVRRVTAFDVDAVAVGHIWLWLRQFPNSLLEFRQPDSCSTMQQPMVKARMCMCSILITVFLYNAKFAALVLILVSEWYFFDTRCLKTNLHNMNMLPLLHKTVIFHFTADWNQFVVFPSFVATSLDGTSPRLLPSD